MLTNCSGKTTLSRVFRSLETHKLPLNYFGSSFTVYGEKGNVAHTGLAGHSYDVRVYNRDFVTDNLLSGSRCATDAVHKCQWVRWHLVAPPSHMLVGPRHDQGMVIQAGGLRGAHVEHGQG